jgi:DNA-binding transcriptional regulator YhcF (GntR family)
MSHEMSHRPQICGAAARAKLTDADVKRIRRRVRAGEEQTELAREFGVNRKTIRRRLDELERAETERAERIAEKRLRRQAAREKRKLFERERDAGVSPPIEPSQSSGSSAQKRTTVWNPYFEWLDRPKNLSGRALSEAMGFIRVRSPDGSIRKGVEREEVEALLDVGWLLDDSFRSDSARRSS